MKDDLIDRLRDSFENGVLPEDVDDAIDEITRLRAELAAQTERADFAWKNTNIIERARQEEMAKRDKAEAELTAIKGQIADPSWVCLEGMSASELAAYDYGSKCCMDALRRILNGEDKGEGTCNEPWEPLRRRVLALAAIKGQEPIAWVSEDSCDRQFINGKPRRIWWECMDGVGTPLYALPVADKNAGLPISAIDDVIQAVAELPDRNSPEDWPEAMLVTGEELRRILVERIAAPVADKDAERLLGLCKWAAGRLTDAGDDEGSAKVMESLATMANGE